MAFRASNALPADQYDRAKKLAFQVKRLAENRSASFATGATGNEILAVADNLGTFRANLNSIRSVPGIAAYAIAQEDDITYDVAAEFGALITAIDAAITEIVITVPTDANDWLLLQKINPDGSLTHRSFTGTQLSGLIATLDVIAASVI